MLENLFLYFSSFSVSKFFRNNFLFVFRRSVKLSSFLLSFFGFSLLQNSFCLSQHFVMERI